MTKGADPTGAGDQDAHGGLLGFYQFNADAIRRGDVTQQVPTVALLECHGKLHAFGTQLIVEGTQIAVIQKAEMIRPLGVVAGKARKGLDRTCGHGGFALPVAANDQGLAAQLKENLRRAIGDRVGDDLGA
jgi:hypothetical protein